MTASGGFEKSYRRLVEWVRQRILAEKKTSRILTMARFYAEIRRANHDGVYHDDAVEDAVEREVLATGRFSFADRTMEGSGTLLLASELVDAGGHSAVVMHWMKLFQGAGDHRLLITRSISPKVARLMKEVSLDYRVCSHRGVARIEEIVREGSEAQRIVLHIHPDDVEGAIAARILRRMGKQIFFYNHADHVFSYGVSSSETVCEISRYGVRVNCESGRTVRGCYLGIPIDFRDPQRRRTIRGGVRTIVSGGQAYKYAPGDVFFGELVDALLMRRDDIRILLAGSTGREPWWGSRAKAWGDRVVFLGQLARDRYMEILDAAEVYVDSFPITGGTAFPEALLGGALVAGLRNPVQGYSPVDALRVEGVPALAQRVIDLLDRDPGAVRRNEEARVEAENAHSLAQFRARVESIYRGETTPALPGGAEGEDIHWLSGKWSRERKIVLPSILRLLNLPLGFCMRFGIATIRSGAFVPNTYRARIVLAVVLKLLPVGGRRRVLAACVRQKRLVFAS